MSARDLAQYLVKKYGPIAPARLQKLLYYCQAWSLAWDNVRLFVDPIEAWATGPIMPDVWEATRASSMVSEVPGATPIELDSDAVTTIASVMEYYGQMGAQVLSDLTHAEDPWIRARVAAGVVDGEPSNEIVSIDSIRSYYSSLDRAREQ